MADVEKKKNKIGRPKEYIVDKVNLEQIEKIASLGMTDVEIGYILGVNESTVNSWKKDPQFAQALKKGKAKADAKVVESLYRRATGYDHEDTYFATYEGNILTQAYVKHYPPDVTAQIFWLKNRRRDEWKDRWELTGADGKSIFDGIVYSITTRNGHKRDGQKNKVPKPAQV